jgi:large subunit ribosomal protein L18
MTRSLKYRRRREGKTNYHKRLKLLQSGQTRMVIRRSNTGMTCQFVTYEPAGDKVIAQATSTDVKKAGLAGVSGKSLPSAYLVGFVAGKRAQAAGISGAIVDLGMQTATKGNRLFAAVKGAIDSGIQIPVDSDVLPPQDRLEGAHIKEHRNVTFDINAVKAKLK